MFGIVTWIIFGLVVGVIAKFLTPGRDPKGCMVTVLIGIAGSFVGGILSSVLTGSAIGGAIHPSGLIMSIIGAIILLLVYRQFEGKR